MALDDGPAGSTAAAGSAGTAQSAKPITAPIVVEPSGPAWMRRVFGTKDFFWLWIVQVVSALGDWVGLFAITALAAHISSQPETATAFVLTARVAPGLFLAPVAGVIVDRFDRKRVMLISDIARALVFMALPFIRSVPGLVVASLLLEIFTMLWSPAKEAIVPGVVPRAKLTDANSLSLVAAYCTMPIAGGVVYGLTAANDALAGISWLGPLQFNSDLGATQALPFYFDAASFVIAGLMVWFLIHPIGRPLSEQDTAPSIRQTVNDIRDGWQFIIANPIVRGVNIGLATGLFGGAMLVPLGPVFADKVIGSPDTFSLFITALGLGVATGIGALSMIQRMLPKRASFLIAAFAGGFALIFAASMSSFWPAALGVFILGVSAGTVYILGFTLLQTATDNELRGRIFSTLLTLVRTCVLISLLLGPVLAGAFETLTSSLLPENADGLPEVTIGGFSLAVPGVRLALWAGGLIIVAAAASATKSMGFHLRDGIRDVRAQLRSRERRDETGADLLQQWPKEDA